MNEIALRTILAGLWLYAAAAPARADATAGVQTKIDSAMKSVKSFVMTTLYPAQAYSATLVYVAPDRSRLAVAIAANTTDVVTVGATSYSSRNGAPFEKSAIAAEDRARIASPGRVKVGAIHSDVTIAGVAYGTFDTTLALGAPVALTCTYDKKSFRLARCVSDEVTRTYGGYDDPGNVVEAPKNFIEAAKDAK